MLPRHPAHCRPHCNLFPDGVSLISVDTIVRQKLRQTRRRLTSEHFFALAAWALVLGFSALGILRGVSLVAPRFPNLFLTAVGWLFLLPLGFAAIVALTHWWSDRRVAKELDARASTHIGFLHCLGLQNGE